MTHTRRGFLGFIAAFFAAKYVTIPEPTPESVALESLTPFCEAYAGIERATFSFWRNRQTSCHSTDEWMKRTMTTRYDSGTYYFNEHGPHVVGSGAQM